MAFRFKVHKGVRVPDEMWARITKLRAYGLHGDVESLEFIDDDYVIVKVAGCAPRRMGSNWVRLHNLLTADELAEPERRRAWKAAGCAASQRPSCSPTREQGDPPPKGRVRI